MILYNVPGRTAVNMLASTQLRLAELPRIVGTKEASGNLEQIKEIAKAGANGAIIGSALIKNFAENKDLKKLKEFAEELKNGTRI